MGSVRGPLDVLKEKQGRELMPYLMIMRERSLERITQLVQTNRSKAHHKQTVDAYPMLRVDGLLDRLGKSQYWILSDVTGRCRSCSRTSI